MNWHFKGYLPHLQFYVHPAYELDGASQPPQKRPHGYSMDDGGRGGPPYKANRCCHTYSAEVTIDLHLECVHSTDRCISIATGGGGRQLGPVAPSTVIRSNPEIRANPKSLGGGGGEGDKRKAESNEKNKSHR